MLDDILKNSLPSPVNKGEHLLTYNEDYNEKHDTDIVFLAEDKRKHATNIEQHIVNTLNNIDDTFTLLHQPKNGPYEAPFDAYDFQRLEKGMGKLRVEFKTLTYYKKIKWDINLIDLIREHKGKDPLSFFSAANIGNGLTAAHVGKHHKKIDYFIFYLNLEDRDVFFSSKYQPDVTWNICYRNNDSAYFKKCNKNKCHNSNYNDLFKCDIYVVKDKSIIHFDGDRSSGTLEEIYKNSYNW